MDRQVPRHPAVNTRKRLWTGLAAVAAAVTTVVVPQVAASAADGDFPPYADLTNGTVELGVNPAGELNIYPDPPQTSASGTGPVGLRYVPTNNDATAAGCTCEAWGVGDSSTGIWGGADTEGAGGSAAGDGETANLTLQNFSVDPGTGFGNSATSDVIVGSRDVDTSVRDADSFPLPETDTPTLEVVHQYQPTSVTPNLYSVAVTITNLADHQVRPVYRRAMDWDIEPTAFDELSTIDDSGSVPVALTFSSDNGFAGPNPFQSAGAVAAVGPPTGDVFRHNGPNDHGAVFDFQFGELDPGQSVTFQTFYGAAGNEADALTALQSVGAQLWSLGEPDPARVGTNDGSPNTFMFAFGGVGGGDLAGGDARPPVSLLVSGPASLDSSSGTPSPNPFKVTATLHNTSSSADSADVTTKLVPGDGLTVVDGGTGDQDLGPLAKSSTTTHDWMLSVTPACATKSYSYTVSSHYAEQASDEPDRHVTAHVTVPGTCTITGTVHDDGDPSNPIGGAPVTACAIDAAGNVTSECLAAVFSAGGTGKYTITTPRTGGWNVSVGAPAAGGPFTTGDGSAHAVKLSAAGAHQDLTLYGPQPLPGGTAFSDLSPWSEDGFPTVNWYEHQTLTAHFCTGGTVTYRIQVEDPYGEPENGAVVTGADGTQDFPMTEGAADSSGGTSVFSAAMSPFLYGAPGYSLDGRTYHGHMVLTYTVTCPDLPATHPSGDFYVDPSGTVVDTAGHPVDGATVTLLTASSDTGPFVAVPNGSSVMSPTNRQNPWTTQADGAYAWDVLPGFYEVTASKTGCVDPNDANNTVVSSPVLTVPPPVTQLNLVLSCGEQPSTSTPTIAHHADITVPSTGAGTPVTFMPPAGDEDGTSLPVFCDPLSGSAFADGDTPVVCTARDAVNKTAVDTFIVHVTGGTGGGGGQPPADVSVNGGPFVYGENGTVTATLPTGAAGTVQFWIDGVKWGAEVPVAGGTATSPTLTEASQFPAAVGSHPVVATFTPSSASAYKSGFGQLTLAVAKAATTTDVAVDGSTVRATVAAVAPGSGTPTGEVAFSQNGESIGTATLNDGVAELSGVTSSDGVSASYGGDDNFTGSSDSVTPSKPVLRAKVHSRKPVSRHGWYSTPVKIKFTCQATSAPLATPCPSPVKLSDDGASQSVTRTITAQDGGTATVVVNRINIDRTDPEVKAAGVEDGKEYKDAPDITCKAHDKTSGIARCTVHRHHRGHGRVHYRVTAVDLAGNKASDRGSYTIKR